MREKRELARNVVILGSPPRMREKRELARNVVILGSPPRMREKRELEAEMTSYLGITPAYAGKTIKCYRLYSLNRDHPRMCGKNM